MGRPIGVSTFHMGTPLPTGLRDALPSVERLMEEVAKVMPGVR